MSQQQLQSICLLLLSILFLGALVWSIYAYVSDDRPLQALIAYQRGEKASTVAEREESFNKALKLYRQLANEYPAPSGNGRIYYNIGNSYFQLEQYPWAVLYYYKALLANARDENTRRNLEITLKKLGLPPPPALGWKEYLLEWGLSLSERWQLLSALIITAGLLASVFLWKGITVLKYYSYIAALLAGLCLLSITYSAWIVFPEVVVLQATSLYQNAGKQYSKVMDYPLSPGVKLNLINLEADKPWAKVRTVQGEIGFVPLDHVGDI